MQINLAAVSQNELTRIHWRALRLLNIYRFFIATLFVAIFYKIHDHFWLDASQIGLYNQTSIVYLMFAVVAIVCTWWQRPALNISLPAQTILDIGFIIVLMFTMGGSKSGTGLLLIITIAGASLVSQGRFALFYAAIATIGLLLEQSYRAVTSEVQADGYTQSAMLSLSCFAIAWLAHTLGNRMQQSETLATQREVDLGNLAQINALITHEMQDGVVVVDQNLMVIHHNIQAETLLGLGLISNAIDWLTLPLNSSFPDLARAIEHWKNEPADSQSTSASMTKLQTETRELRLRFLPVGANREDGAVIFIEDWSQTQTQAQQLKLAALGRLTANIAHEIRNPLSAISHANQLLQEDEANTATTQRMLQIIANNVQRVDQIVKDVLELNRRDRTNQESIALAPFLSEFYHQFCAVENIPQGVFQLSIGKNSTQINFDQRHLNQILWNLCKNGWRHCTKTQASLQLSLVKNNKTQAIRIEVTDDGSGVPAEIRPHLFEPFFTTENSGTGLGLYIARELSEANGAKIQYKAAEIGSQFILHLSKS